MCEAAEGPHRGCRGPATGPAAPSHADLQLSLRSDLIVANRFYEGFNSTPNTVHAFALPPS